MAEERRAGCALVVEDEVALRTLIKRVLTSHGYRVVDVDDCRAAEEAFEQQIDEIDWVFSDLRLVDGDGVELLHRLRRRRPDLPAVLSSGDGASVDFHDEPDCVYLPKPFRVSQLMAAVAALNLEAFRT